MREFQRGAVRLHILHHAAAEEIHGAWMTEELASHGYRISPGTLYPTLHRLEAEGLLVSEQRVVDGRTRRVYKATEAGKQGKKGLRKITSAATMHRINDTLSSALSWGVKREQLFPRNWAQLVELPAVTRPKPLVWTSERIEHWKRIGEKPGPVMVWTPELTGQFLDFVKDDWLYELWHSFIFLGPRRGEMAALPWTEVSLDALWLRISQQIVEVAYELYGEAPKTDSVRTLSLSLESGDNLAAFRAKQEKQRQQWGDAYVESGRVWTHENGEALHPDWISRRFTRLIELSGLPPVRLHDLRHLATTLSLLAGHDIKVVQEKLGALLAPDHLRHVHQRAARDDAGRGRVGHVRRPLPGAHAADDPGDSLAERHRRLLRARRQAVR
ncbi:helix-turn-helix transcriptional regulator [Streptomyces marianii]|uniref:helix-turn-helix transcriptional regulator n=1 Tax=Streptomyces marianii TaxID=1817406 RepID=UPI0014861843|nr:helix-turn-helix transcriptional regulator [Streptomyces marianii]